MEPSSSLRKNLHQFTDPSGAPVWIAGAFVSIIRRPVGDQWGTGTKAVIYMGGQVQAVQETPEQAVTILEGEDDG